MTFICKNEYPDLLNEEPLEREEIHESSGTEDEDCPNMENLIKIVCKTLQMMARENYKVN